MIFSLVNLIKAYFSCRKHKRNTVNALKFEANWEKHLLQLQRELLAGNYQPGQSICFAVYYPKIREVFAAKFRDRVIHHLFVKQLEPFYEKRFCYDSLACRPNKGCQFGIKRLQQFMHKVTRNQTAKAYYLQVDVRNFFGSINKNKLLSIISQDIQNWLPNKQADDLNWLATTIISHSPTQNFYLKGEQKYRQQLPAQKSLFGNEAHKGLPIGNLTSQFFANVYLDAVDQFIKRRLKIKYYLGTKHTRP